LIVRVKNMNYWRLMVAGIKWKIKTGIFHFF